MLIEVLYCIEFDNGIVDEGGLLCKDMLSMKVCVVFDEVVLGMM